MYQTNTSPSSPCARRLGAGRILGTVYVIDEAGDALVSCEWVGADLCVHGLTVHVEGGAMVYDDFRTRDDVPLAVLETLAELAAAW